MEVINIHLGKKDGAPSKILEIRTQMEGRGHITSFLNMGEVAQALGRPPSYIIKYIGLGVLAPTKTREEKGIFHVGVACDAEKLAQVVNKFIKTYVECYYCGHPETELFLNEEARSVKLACGDCGSISEVRDRKPLIDYMIRLKSLEAEKRPPLEI